MNLNSWFTTRHRRLAGLALALLLATSALADPSDVRVIGQMRRMFMAHDIGPNVELRSIVHEPHIYALGPLAGLKGEITVVDGDVLVSTAKEGYPAVASDTAAKSVFLVYASVPAWRSVTIPTNVISESDLASFLGRTRPTSSRTALLVRGTAVRARYHIQNFQAPAQQLTHEAHDQAKVFFDLTNAPVQLVGFFSNREDDGGSFVHPGETLHVHLVSDDRKSMGHLESISLAPNAKLFLPQSASH